MSLVQDSPVLSLHLLVLSFIPMAPEPTHLVKEDHWPHPVPGDDLGVDGSDGVDVVDGSEQ